MYLCCSGCHQSFGDGSASTVSWNGLIHDVAELPPSDSLLSFHRFFYTVSFQ